MYNVRDKINRCARGPTGHASSHNGAEKMKALHAHICLFGIADGFSLHFFVSSFMRNVASASCNDKWLTIYTYNVQLLENEYNTDYTRALLS